MAYWSLNSNYKWKQSSFITSIIYFWVYFSHCMHIMLCAFTMLHMYQIKQHLSGYIKVKDKVYLASTQQWSVRHLYGRLQHKYRYLDRTVGACYISNWTAFFQLLLTGKEVKSLSKFHLWVSASITSPHPPPYRHPHPHQEPEPQRSLLHWSLWEQCCASQLETF